MKELNSYHTVHLINSSRPNPRRREILSKIFISHLFCGASKGFTKAFKAFMKPFEEHQRSAKIKI